MTLKTKPKKEKINIMGTKYKVEEPIAKTMKALSDALHAHEVALLINHKTKKRKIREQKNNLLLL